MDNRALGPRVSAALDTLIKGSEDERDALRGDMRTFEPNEQRQLKAEVIRLLTEDYSREDFRLNDPKTAPTVRGWLVYALGTLKPFDDQSASVLHTLAREDESDWVRYWSLAQLFDFNPHFADDAANEKDASDLVRTLSKAIRASFAPGEAKLKWLPRLLESSELRRKWVALRALQIVGDADAAPQLVALLTTEAPDTIVYDVLLALTTERMGHAGIAEIHKSLEITAILNFVLRACRGAAAHRVRRFANIVKPLPHDRVRSLLSAAVTANKDGEPARALLTALGYAVPPGVTVPTGEWRLEFAYRAVLDQPARFELLETLDVTNLREAIQAAAAGAPQISPDDLLAQMRARHGSAAPNALWTAWVETVQAAKLDQN